MSVKLEQVQRNYRLRNHFGMCVTSLTPVVKGKDYCPIEIIKELTDKGQFHYLTKSKGPQVGNYLYTAQFLPLR